MKRVTGFFSAITIAALPLFTNGQTGLQTAFKQVPDSVKPSVYWYWLCDNISQQGVQKDIEAMAKVGIGRAFIGNIGLNKEETPYGNVKLFSDEWWKVTQTALATATKTGVKIGLFNSPGWSQSGGPWIKPSETMRYLAGNEIAAEGPIQISQKFTTPANFQQVAVLAFPQPAFDNDLIARYHPSVASEPSITGLNAAADGDTTTAVLFPKEINSKSVVTIDITSAQNFTARSLLLYPAKQPFRANVELQVKTGDGYQTIKAFEFNRSNPAENVGFMPYAPVAVSFDEVAGTAFRLRFSEIHGNGGIAEIGLSQAPAVERFIEKQLGKMFPTPLPLWNEYQWPQQAQVKESNTVIDPSKMIDLTKMVAADGTLNWNVPQGKWIIIQYGMLPTGVTNAPATPEGRGLEVDKINREVMTSHFNAFVGKIQQRIPEVDRKSLQFVVADSYETGSQNWTDGMAAAFKKQYGYDALPWLPVLSGRVVGSQDKSDRFLWDLRRLVADKVAYDYVGGLRDVSHQHGLKLWLENYGHWGFPSEFLKYGGQSDEVGGEFWNEGDLGSIECRAASSAAHIYGKTKVSAESFTAGGMAYARYPALLKKRGDWSFTEGINNTLLHVMIEQPYEDKKPGVNAGFGTEFNRNNTWFFQGKAFIDYIRRCNFLLQQGKPVNDIAYFIGEDAPKMTGVRDPALPAGYQFDYINAEVIENRLTVKNGRLVLPDGMSYRMLVLPPLETMRPELLSKIKQLVEQGAVVLGPKPLRSPSLQNFPAADAKVQDIAAELWGKADGKAEKINHYGKGMLLNGTSMQDALALLKLVPDVTFDKEGLLYTHRASGETEIYFISNQQDKVMETAPLFRVVDKQPELWDAVTGNTRELPSFSSAENGIKVPLQLQAYQSAFIIFRKKITGNTAKDAQNFPAPSATTELKQPWLVKFDQAMRGPVSAVTFNELTDWSKHSDEQMKNYSGTAVYTTTFKVGNLAKDKRMVLNLGTVAVMAKVKLNGKDLGTVWTAPYETDVAGALKPGENKLEIEVVNTWVNRLIGDSKLPEAERKTWSNVNIYTPESNYQPAGLIGPVTLQEFPKQ